MSEQHLKAADGDEIDWGAEPDVRTQIADLVPLSLLDGRDPRRDVFEVADQILEVVQAALPERNRIAAQALRDAADAMKYPDGAPYEVWASGAGNWLRERADALTTD